MKSTKDNDVYNLILLPEGAKAIGCNWRFKTKRESNGNVERYNVCLVAKGFKETFSRDSLKDPFKVIKTLMTHFNIQLYHMGVKIAFLNGDIDKTIIME